MPIWEIRDKKHTTLFYICRKGDKNLSRVLNRGFGFSGKIVIAHQRFDWLGRAMTNETKFSSLKDTLSKERMLTLWGWLAGRARRDALVLDHVSETKNRMISNWRTNKAYGLHLGHSVSRYLEFSSHAKVSVEQESKAMTRGIFHRSTPSEPQLNLPFAGFLTYLMQEPKGSGEVLNDKHSKNFHG